MKKTLRMKRKQTKKKNQNLVIKRKKTQQQRRMKSLTTLFQTRSQLMTMSSRTKMKKMKQKRKSLNHKIQKRLLRPRRIISRVMKKITERRSYHNQPKYNHNQLSNLQLKMGVNTLKTMLRPHKLLKMLNQLAKMATMRNKTD